jgi:hypothetical protein
MGLADLYPFVLSAGVIEKLGFIHELLRSHAQKRPFRDHPASDKKAEAMRRDLVEPGARH